MCYDASLVSEGQPRPRHSPKAPETIAEKPCVHAHERACARARARAGVRIFVGACMRGFLRMCVHARMRASLHGCMHKCARLQKSLVGGWPGIDP